MRLSSMTDEEWPRVVRSYRKGISTGEATFESQVPGWADWNRENPRLPPVLRRPNLAP